MISWIKIYLIALSIFLIIDFLWLGLVAKNFYSRHLGEKMKEEVNPVPAIVFYLLFVAGLVFFVTMPAIESIRWQEAFFPAIFFGLVSYATYDLTNFATLKEWPFKVVVIDLIWGSLLTGVVSLLTYLLYLSLL